MSQRKFMERILVCFDTIVSFFPYSTHVIYYMTVGEQVSVNIAFNHTHIPMGGTIILNREGYVNAKNLFTSDQIIDFIMLDLEIMKQER